MADALIPSAGDLYDWYKDFRTWREKRKREALLAAWQDSDIGRAYAAIVRYYEGVLPLFSYPRPGGKKEVVPLYVDPAWSDLQDVELIFRDREARFRPDRRQRAFWDFYCDYRKRLRGEGTWPLRPRSQVFRLVDFVTNNGKLRLEFELGEFMHSVICQYMLEHELVMLLATRDLPHRSDFELRNSIAPDLSMLHSFFREEIGRIGVCNLILLRVDDNTYAPMVHARGGLSMVKEPLFDAVSSCIFEVATTPVADIKLRHTVLREVYEELFGNPEVAGRSRSPDPEFFYKADGIADLIQLLNKGRAVFQVTAFCIDMLRLVPEITSLLVVNDPSYYHDHFSPSDSSRAPFKLSEEHDPTSQFRVPAELTDVDDYFLYGVPSDPNEAEGRGFLPLKWTLPAGLSFYLGLKRAVNRHLMH